MSLPSPPLTMNQLMDTKTASQSEYQRDHSGTHIRNPRHGEENYVHGGVVWGRAFHEANTNLKRQAVWRGTTGNVMARLIPSTVLRISHDAHADSGSRFVGP